MNALVTAKKGQSLRLVLFSLSLFTMLVIVGLPVLAVVLYAVFPHFNELSLADPFATFLPSLSDPRLIGATFNSLRLSLAVTFIAILIALPLAYLRGCFSSTMGKVWDVAFLIPFLIPPYIGALSWMQLLQRNGFVEQALGFNLSGPLYSFSGLSVVMALHVFPLIYFTTSKSFAIIGARYGDVAKVFGGRPVPVFFRIYVPMILPALVSSGLIVFVLSIEEFGTPEILGRRFGFEVMVTAIHDKFTNWPIDLSGASVLCLILIFIAFVAYQLHRKIVNKFQSTIDNQTIVAPKAFVPPLVLAGVVALFVGVFVIAVFLPILSILLSAVMDTLSGGVAWDNMSLSHIKGLFAPESDALQAIMTSLSLALAAAVLTGGIAFVLVFTVVRLRIRGSIFLDFLSILPNSIPGMAVAVGLILTWNMNFWPVTPYNTVVILLLAYLCLMLPYPVRMLTATLRKMPRSLDDAAYISGAREWAVIFKVLMPLLAPTALAAGFIVFAVSTRELVSSLMLAPPGVETVATYVFHQFDQGSIGAGMAMSLITIFVSGTIIAVGQYWQERRLK